MDRNGAHFKNTVSSIKKRLSGWGEPVVIQLPLFKCGENFGTKDGTGNKFEGVIDLVNLEIVTFNSPSGSVVKRLPINENDCVYQEAINERSAMIEKLGEYDEIILDQFLNAELDATKIDSSALKESLRKCTINGAAVPILCGASFRNMGVQPILVI